MRRKKIGDADLTTVCDSRMMNVNFLGDISRNAYDDKNAKFHRIFSWLLTKGKFGENGGSHKISPQQSSQSSERFSKASNATKKKGEFDEFLPKVKISANEFKTTGHQSDENGESG